jgi:hypothetical protein
MGKSTAFIQWKGTDACMDIRCECGVISHYDGMFAYFIKCPSCKAVYQCQDTIKLTPADNVDRHIVKEGVI